MNKILGLLVACWLCLSPQVMYAANTWSTTRCNFESPCQLSYDTAGETSRISAQCPGGVFMELSSDSTGSIDVYSGADSTFANYTQSRAMNEAGTWVDVTLDGTTPRVSGLPGFYFILDVISGSGTALVGCGGS